MSLHKIQGYSLVKGSRGWVFGAVVKLEMPASHIGRPSLSSGSSTSNPSFS